MSNIRPELVWFAQRMEDKLVANEWKGGWQDEPIKELHRHLAHQVDIIQDGLTRLELGTPDYRTAIMNTCTNAANYAMMIADIMRKERLESKGGIQEDGH